MNRWMALLASVICVIALGACGSSDDGSGTTTESSVEKKSNKATGSPVVLGTLDVPNQPQFTDGVKAAVKYLNEEAGGLNGHEIELKTCSANQTPQQGIKCANELVRDGAVAVIVGEDNSIDSAFPIYERAGVPVISERIVTNQMLVNPVAVSLGPGIPATLAAFAKFARDEYDAERAVSLQPAGTPQDLLDQLVGGPLKAAGIDPSFAFFSPDKPNYDATFAAIAQKDPNVVVANIDDNNQCAPAMKSAKSTGSEFTLFQITCSDQEVFDAAGSLADGVVFYGPLDAVTGEQSPEVDLYNHIMETYGSTGTGFQSAVAVSPVLTLASVMEKQTGEVTKKSILDAFKGAKGEEIFMGPPIECGVSKAFPALCTLSLRFFTGDNGEKKPLTDWVSGAEYLPQG